MPVIQFHMPEGLLIADAEVGLLEQASRLLAKGLASPIDRIRVFLTVYPSTRYATDGCAGGHPVPYFEFVVLEGRSLEQRQALMSGFAVLLSDATGVPVEQVRGMCRRVDPDEWTIGISPASRVRANHVDALASSNLDRTS